MPYVAIGQVAQAIQSLQRFHAFFGVTFLSMKESGVKVGAPTPWGSQQENALLDKYFSPPGHPPDKPYFVPFGRPDSDTYFWRNPKYSGGTLQRARTTDNFKDALEHPSKSTWSFVPAYIIELVGELPKTEDATKEPIRLPVFDLASWIYRDQELPPTLEAVERKFREEFGLTDDAEYSQLFDASQPNPAQFYSDDELDREELIRIIRGIPEGPSLAGRTESDLLTHIENWISTQAGLSLPAGFVKSFYAALKAQRFVVLAGRPGTGKTAFVRAFSDALKKFFVNSVSLLEISVAQDFSDADVVGYEKIAGGLAATQLSRELFLSGRPNDIYVVLLDEMNLSHVDLYLARLLPAFESDASVELPGMSTSLKLPPDAYLVGTVNSYIEESTRLPLSGPVKRRANVIEMPNSLATLVLGGQRAEFESACLNLLRQTRNRIVTRGDEGHKSTLDNFRIQGLDAAMQDASEIRSKIFMDALWSICEVCCSDGSTAPTFGVIQDVLDYVAMAAGPVMLSLSDQIAQKIAPQLNGPADVVRKLLGLIESWDGATDTFSVARTSLEALLRTEDAGSGLVVYSY